MRWRWWWWWRCCLYPNELLLLPLWKMFKMRKLLLFLPLPLSLHVNNERRLCRQRYRWCWCCISGPHPFEHSSFSRCCVCRSAKLAEQSHIPPAATYQGGARQGADGQAEVLLHLQDIQATACLALQSLRQLRGSLRSPLSLGKCPCVYPPTPYVIYCPAVPCCWHWAAKPQMWAKSKRDRQRQRERTFAFLCVCDQSLPTGADFNPISGQATARWGC